MAQDTYVTPTIQASTTTWAQYKTGGLKVVLDNLIAQNAAKADPSTQATVAVTSAAGGLAAGTYYCSYTFVDAFGETLVGTSESASFTVSGTSELATVTLPSKPTGVQSMNLYVTGPGGAAASEKLFASGITGTSFALTDTIPADIPPTGIPESNSTGAASHVQRIYSLLPIPASEGTQHRLNEALSNYLHGDPIPRREVVRMHVNWAGILKLWYTALNEIGTLIAANMPTTVTYPTTGAGIPAGKWTLP